MINICTECVKEFETKRKNKTGLCKKCYLKDYNRRNAEALSASKKEYREKNKDKISDRDKAYYQKNKETIVTKKKEYQERTKETRAAYTKEWVRDNPQKVRANSQRCKARRRQAEGAYGFQELFDLLEYYEYTCVYCGKHIFRTYHLDHIVPLARGGTNFIDNIQPLCPTCNTSKQAKLPWDFEEEIGFVRDPDFWCNPRLYSNTESSHLVIN